MKLIDILSNLFSHSKEQIKDKAPDGICDLSCGYEKYDGEIRETF